MPPRLEWTDDLSVGVEVLDHHHQQIVELINRVSRTMFTGAEADMVTVVLHDLRDYATFHFREEEAHLEAQGYSDLESHRRLHRHMAGQIDEIIAMHDGGPRKVVASELHEFLSNWLVRHIRNADHAYAPLFAPPVQGAYNGT